MQPYRFLGVLLSASGTVSHAKLELYKRGLKAFFKLKRIFGYLSPNVNTSLHLFDHTVKPILLYGCDVCGTCYPSAAAARTEEDFKLEKGYNNLDCENLAVKYYKYILVNIKEFGRIWRSW